MRSLLFILLLLLLNLPVAYGLQQYTEGACILLDQQIQRFSRQPQSSNYRNAKSEYEKNCRKPTRYVPQETEPRRETTPVKVETPAAPVEAPLPEVLPVQAPPEPVEPVVALPEALPATDETPVATQMALPVPIPLEADVVASADAEFQFDALLMQMINNLPLIIANIFALLLAVFLLTNWLGLNLPGFKGIFAEYKLNRLLRWRLARGYRHFRKLKLLTAKEELVVVDHLVLSPFGIFVIMVKGYRGSIAGDVAEANWLRQYFGTKKQFMNPLHQNFKHVEAVKHHLQVQGTELAQHVHSVIAFSRVAQFKTEMPANVTYVDTTAAYLKKFEEPCFDDEQLNRFAALLRQASTAL